MKRIVVVLGIIATLTTVRLKPDTTGIRFDAPVVSGFIRTVSAQSVPKQAVVETSAGTFVLDLTPDRKSVV